MEQGMRFAGKKIAILQSDYIPWKGYFDIIRSVDEFVIYDEAQYTRRDWRNRNLIKTARGVKWLTIPVKVKDRYLQKISETEISDHRWAERHWRTLCHNYGKAPFFGKYEDMLKETYAAAPELKMLSLVNRLFLETVCSILGITTRLTDSSLYTPGGDRNRKIVSVCRSTGAGTYFTGPSATKYLDMDLLIAEGIKVAVANYEGYPEYEQPWPPFSHNVSILDLLFSAGDDAEKYMKLLA